MTSIPKPKNIGRRRNGIVAEAPLNLTESSLLLNQHLEFSPEVAALMASYHGPLVTTDATSDHQAEIFNSGDRLLAESHSHLSLGLSNSEAHFDGLKSAPQSLEPLLSSYQLSVEPIHGQSNDITNANKTVESPSPFDSSATLKKVDSAPSVDSSPSYWAYTGSSFNSSLRPLVSSSSHRGSVSSSQILVNSDTFNKPIPCGPLNAWYLIKGG